MSPLVATITFGSILGSGLIAGVFFAFSTFVMRGLAQVAPTQGILAMQSINRTVINPLTMGTFMGTAALGAFLAGYALWHWYLPGAAYLFAGGLLYVIGTFGVTAAFNVPLNDTLASVDAAAQEAHQTWRDYVSRWTAWNHIRTIAAALATLAFVMAFRSADATRLNPSPF